ncbi:hypothetical protein RISK_006013 [Rhodopirellula islandica]|uniref:Uncharacterized protein n=1 Tax=Rhodopirellula islandica TaxID=595434 RepID=A0A0J1E8P0_RHOIS|nr:hypothetical protein RISK_006013 [Rhodopirellula islandica]
MQIELSGEGRSPTVTGDEPDAGGFRLIEATRPGWADKVIAGASGPGEGVQWTRSANGIVDDA